MQFVRLLSSPDTSIIIINDNICSIGFYFDIISVGFIESVTLVSGDGVWLRVVG